MSRVIIGWIVAAVILVLTAVAYFVTTSNLEQKIHKDVRVRVRLAQQQLIQNASLEGLGLLKRAEVAAADPAYVRALKSEGGERSSVANLAFSRFIQGLGAGEREPDILALTDATGDVVVQLGVRQPLAKKWKDDKDTLIYPALRLALTERVFTSDVLDFENTGLMEVGVAPIVDNEADVVMGALVVARPITSKVAQQRKGLLGADVAYFHAERVSATSFTKQSSGEEDTAMQAKLGNVLAKDDLGKVALSQGIAPKVVSVDIEGKTYLALAGRLPRFASKRLPDDYPPSKAGAAVMMSLSDALAPLATIKTTILLLGLAAFVLAALANFLTSRRILHQADEIEDAINEIIQGNLDRTVRAVGADLDGLAHALNVMLARLLGRPEPGEEEYDEHGNLVQAAPVTFDNEELANLSPADAPTMALAQEPEPEYYNRIFNEYIQARQQLGESTAGTHYETFVAKLRFNEGNLKAKYQCSAVRFKVVVKDDKVTLKPVPIV